MVVGDLSGYGKQLAKSFHSWATFGACAVYTRSPSFPTHLAPKALIPLFRCFNSVVSFYLRKISVLVKSCFTVSLYDVSHLKSLMGCVGCSISRFRLLLFTTGDGVVCVDAISTMHILDFSLVLSYKSVDVFGTHGVIHDRRCRKIREGLLLVLVRGWL